MPSILVVGLVGLAFCPKIEGLTTNFLLWLRDPRGSDLGLLKLPGSHMEATTERLDWRHILLDHVFLGCF